MAVFHFLRPHPPSCVPFDTGAGGNSPFFRRFAARSSRESLLARGGSGGSERAKNRIFGRFLRGPFHLTLGSRGTFPTLSRDPSFGKSSKTPGKQPVFEETMVEKNGYSTPRLVGGLDWWDVKKPLHRKALVARVGLVGCEETSTWEAPP